MGFRDEKMDRGYKDIISMVEARGIRIDYSRIGKRSTICLLTEKDGWETTGVSYTQFPENFDYSIGKYYALEDALDNLGSGRFWQSVVEEGIEEEINNLNQRLDEIGGGGEEV